MDRTRRRLPKPRTNQDGSFAADQGDIEGFPCAWDGTRFLLYLPADARELVSEGEAAEPLGSRESWTNIVQLARGLAASKSHRQRRAADPDDTASPAEEPDTGKEGGDAA